MNQRTVVVLGGSGFVGRHVVARLASASHRVVIPTRSRERARHLILLPTVDVVEADVHDEATLSRLISSAFCTSAIAATSTGSISSLRASSPTPAVRAVCRDCCT